jgi:hypothetical protein
VHTDLIDPETAATPLKYLQKAKHFIVREVLP